ncbi:hypothetical protein, conserved [Plasmodium gonderi]|uniref:Uncharacterized protein n=1 Tax=Plasmodium gonderi TaxID=77519 RepID=A0A1Y1JHQ7_PLAGO|nr:hypothetical protein, conserved [Plasmodium gonderi]GAW80757.1 hypothetical protein, conserved [Plasmodium gonderi]
MNFLNIFTNEKKKNNESVSTPNCELQQDNNTSSPHPVTNDVKINYNHVINPKEEGGVDISPTFDNVQQVNMRNHHMYNSVIPTHFESAANALITVPTETEMHIPPAKLGNLIPGLSLINMSGTSVGDTSISVSNVNHPSVNQPIMSHLNLSCDNMSTVQLDSQLNSKLDNQLDSRLNNQLDSRLNNQLDSRLNNQLDSRLNNQLDSRLNNQLNSQLNSKLDNQLDSRLNNQLDNQLNSCNGYEQKENYEYVSGNLSRCMSYDDGELFAYMQKRKEEGGLHNCSFYNTHVKDTYGEHDKCSVRDTYNSSRNHASQYRNATNHSVASNLACIQNADKDMTNQNYFINSTSIHENYQSKSDVHVKNTNVQIAHDNITSGGYMNSKQKYTDELCNESYRESYNKYNNSETQGVDNIKTSGLQYGHAKEGNDNTTTGNMMIPITGLMNNSVDYVFTNRNNIDGMNGQETMNNNYESNVVHSFGHQINGMNNIIQQNVTDRKKGQNIINNQSYMNLYTPPVGNTDSNSGEINKITSSKSKEKMKRKKGVLNNYNYEQDVLPNFSPDMKKNNKISGRHHRDNMKKFTQINDTMNHVNNDSEFFGKAFLENGTSSISSSSGSKIDHSCSVNTANKIDAYNGEILHSKKKEQRGNREKQYGTEDKESVRGTNRIILDEEEEEGEVEKKWKRHKKGKDSIIRKTVRWAENEEAHNSKGSTVTHDIEEDDEKGVEYYYEKTMDFLKKEFSINNMDKKNKYINDRDILEKTPFFKLVNFEKKLATERKRVLNYYNEDRKQIYSSSINKDKQFSHIFFNNEKYYDAKEILAYLLPYHTFYLDNICVDSYDDDQEYPENFQNDVKEIEKGISQIKDSFRSYTNPSVVWSFNKIIDRTDDQYNKRKKKIANS